MKRRTRKALSFLVGVLFVAPAAAWAGGVTCDQINQALQSGKNQQQVAKELKVSLSQVRKCAEQHKK
ncbi:MAG: hypothetical protein KatS3mg076_0911 [Candidatus Binatia bacterium]|nr:MAG: hypothetical protein KatS3mg076_0911 [Candidatus Binatia bacterium]